MKKLKVLNINYKGISGKERFILEKIKESALITFGAKEVERISGFSTNSVHSLLFSLRRKGVLVKLMRDRHALKETLFEKKFLVATELFKPCYISFWSALSYYGFTEQQPAAIQIASTKQLKRVELKEIIIWPTTIKPKNFFGYEELNGFVIASEEKALVDSILMPENAGGLNEFIKCLENAWIDINKDKFIQYLLMTNNKSVNSRAGFLIERMKLPIKKELLEKLRKNSSKGFIRLDQTKKIKNEYNKNWKIIINTEIKEEEIF